MEDYDAALRAAQVSRFDPPKVNLDTGRPTRPGEYNSSDRTYAELLHKLKCRDFADVTSTQLNGRYREKTPALAGCVA